MAEQFGVFINQSTSVGLISILYAITPCLQYFHLFFSLRIVFILGLLLNDNRSILDGYLCKLNAERDVDVAKQLILEIGSGNKSFVFGFVYITFLIKLHLQFYVVVIFIQFTHIELEFTEPYNIIRLNPFG